jgi:predicted AlkP superfamily phosphohydrolase/phosphomutase
MTNDLQEKNALSPETMQEYQKLQQLMKEINSPELRKAMDAMQKAMQQVDPEQMRQAMKNMKFNEEEFKKGIERTMNLLKRMQAEQKTDALIRRAEELAQKQDELTQ